MLSLDNTVFYFAQTKLMSIFRTQTVNLIISLALMAIALLAITITGDAGDFAITVLTFLGVYSLLLENRETKNHRIINSFSVLTTALGLLLLAISFSLFEAAVAARTLPLFLLLIFWSLQSGTEARLRQQYWKPLLLVLLLALPDRSLLMPLVYPFLYLFGWDAMTFPTAHLATVLTSLTGLSATLSHLDINMENAIVTVWKGCDGSRNMDFLLRLGIMVIVTLPIKPSRWVLTISTAVILAFFINVIRVTLLAHLANSGDFSLFDYWHEGDGSKLFNLSAIILFAIFAYFQIINKSVNSNRDSSEEVSQPQS